VVKGINRAGRQNMRERTSIYLAVAGNAVQNVYQVQCELVLCIAWWGRNDGMNKRPSSFKASKGSSVHRMCGCLARQPRL